MGYETEEGRGGRTSGVMLRRVPGKLPAYAEESERGSGNSTDGRGGIGGSHLHDKYWQNLAWTQILSAFYSRR